MDVGEHTAVGDGDAAEELVELLVVADSELQVAGGDAALLLSRAALSASSRISAQILHDGGEVYGGTATDAGSVAAELEVAGDTAHGELESRLSAVAGGLASLLAAASFSFSRHLS